MTRDIDSMKKSFDKILTPGDRSHVMVDCKTAVVKFGSELYVCDVQKGDPNSCELNQKVSDADPETFSKIEEYLKGEVKNIDDYLKKEDTGDYIPYELDSEPLTEEEKKEESSDESNADFIPD